MTICDLLEQKKYTVYSLSKKTGISKTTLFDIFSGRSQLMECRGRILLQLSKTFDISIEELLELDPILYIPAYEEEIPDFLKEDISKLKKRKGKNDPLYDCYLDEANSSINVCEVENMISKEQATYLRKKFLR